MFSDLQGSVHLTVPRSLEALALRPVPSAGCSGHPANRLAKQQQGSLCLNFFVLVGVVLCTSMPTDGSMTGKDSTKEPRNSNRLPHQHLHLFQLRCSSTMTTMMMMTPCACPQAFQHVTTSQASVWEYLCTLAWGVPWVYLMSACTHAPTAPRTLRRRAHKHAH